MNKTAREAVDAIEQIAPLIEKCQTRAWIAVPYTAIAVAAESAKQTKLVIGAQNLHDAREGAFTGEISALMLLDAGASFVLLGHSERRHLFGETDAFIHRKVLRALQDDLQPVLCVGETLPEREAGKTKEILERQIQTALSGVSEKEAEKIIVAYEPVWAIGTGNTATPKMAQEAHLFCRRSLEDLFGHRMASLIRILYGGSVKAENMKDIVSQKEIDGVLVGGASLEPKSFAAIIQQSDGIRC